MPATRRRRQFAHCNLETHPLYAAVGEQWRDGDPRAIGIVFDEFRVEFAHRLCQTYRPHLAPDDAEEIVVGALEHAWERRERFDPAKGTLAAWLWCIALHSAFDVHRSGWRRERTEERPLPPEELALIAAPFGEEAGDESADWPLFEAAKQILSEVEFAIIWADACSPCGVASSEELSEQLGLCPATIRSHRARGRKKLREELPRFGYGGPRRPR